MNEFFYKAKAIDNICPNAQWAMSDGVLTWLDATKSEPSDQEINAEVERIKQYEPLQSCKDKAKQLIAASDWAALPDVGLKNAAEFVTYRGILRGLIITPVADPVWPTEPESIWE
jgi:hypothetical protein